MVKSGGRSNANRLVFAYVSFHQPQVGKWRPNMSKIEFKWWKTTDDRKIGLPDYNARNARTPNILWPHCLAVQQCWSTKTNQSKNWNVDKTICLFLERSRNLSQTRKDLGNDFLVKKIRFLMCKRFPAPLSMFENDDLKTSQTFMQLPKTPVVQDHGNNMCGIGLGFLTKNV